MLRFPLLRSIAVLVLAATSLHAEILVKSGEKIAFLGDSITQQGWGRPTGYPRLVIEGLKANGVEVEGIGAGISGHKSNQMLARLQKDVLDKKPQWMTLSCGVNDVWHGKNGIPLDDEMAKTELYANEKDMDARGTYRKNITEIIDKAQAAGVKPVILTSTVIKEKLDSPENVKAIPYNEFLRELAKEKKLPLADLGAMFQEKIKAANKPGNAFTGDGVHMNAEGDKIMATGVLKALGLNDAQIKKSEEAWANIPVPTPKPKPLSTPAAAPVAATPAAPAAK